MNLGEVVRQPRSALLLTLVHSSALPFSSATGFSQSSKESIPHRAIPWECIYSSSDISLMIFSTAFHEVSVYPKKELPFFILFTAGLCSFTAMLALLTHQFPELMGVFAKAVSISQREASGKGQRSKRSSIRDMGECLVEMDMPVLIICSLFSFHYHQWN